MTAERDAEGNITSVAVTYPDDFTGQMLRYGEQFSFLPDVNRPTAPCAVPEHFEPDVQHRVSSVLFLCNLLKFVTYDSICFCLDALLVRSGAWSQVPCEDGFAGEYP